MVSSGTITTILFDVGGTLLHINPLLFGKAISNYIPLHTIPCDFRMIDCNAKTYALEGSQEAKAIWTRYFGHMLTEMRIGKKEQEKILHDLIDIHPLEDASRKLWSYVEAGTRETLEYLHSHYRLGVISNNVGTAVLQLKDASIDRFFETIIDSRVIGLRKPHPEIFLYAAKTMNVKPHECAYVGDMFDWDCVGALSAGMKPILVYGSPQDREKAKEYPRIIVVPDIAALAEIL